MRAISMLSASSLGSLQGGEQHFPACREVEEDTDEEFMQDFIDNLAGHGQDSAVEVLPNSARTTVVRELPFACCVTASPEGPGLLCHVSLHRVQPYPPLPRQARV